MLRTPLPWGRPLGLVSGFGLAALLCVAAELPAQAPPKPPLKHSDYEIWNKESGVTLSPDGQHLAYAVTPGDGDGAVVVRNLATGSEQRFASGGRSATAPPAEPGGEPGAGPPVSPFAGAAGNFRFTPDSKRLVFNLAPPKSAVDKARAAKKKADEMPKTVVAVLDTATGKIAERLEKVRTFTVVGDGAGFLILHKEPKPEEQPKDQPKAGEAAPMGQEQPRGQGGTGRRPPGVTPGQGGRPGGAATTPQVQAGSELVVRNLADGTEASYTDVATFSVTRDFKQLVYTVRSRTADRNGVYVAALGATGPGAAVKAGPGRYTGLAWDDKQTQLAFFYSEQPAAGAPGAAAAGPAAASQAGPPKVRVYVWQRSRPAEIAADPMPMAAAASAVVLTRAQVPTVPAAVEVLGPAPAGLKDGWAVVDRGGLAFSDDGVKLTVATAPVPPPGTRPEQAAEEAATTPPAGAVAGTAGRLGPAAQQAADPNRVNLDIWHWKDEAIQPMQQVRSRQDRSRTFKAVVFLDTKEFKHLDSEDVTVTVPDHGDWGLASSDLRFRGQLWLSPMPRDYTLVNIRTGAVPKTAQLPGQEFAVYRSPKGTYLVAFDGKHWHSLTVPDGKKANLTGKIPAKFFNEEDDHPATPPAYGMSGFSSDEKFILLSDKYDIWKVALDGSSAENLTKVGREQHVRFRINRFADPDERDEPGVNLAKPLFLTATNLNTYDSGYYRLDPGGKPRMLVMGARQYGSPTKARKADTYIFTVSSFADYPDYYVADKDFKEVKRVTDVNPRVKEFNWGKAELVTYRSVDGVPLKGVLIKPEDFDPTKKYPMIVYIYERLSQGLHGFRMPSAGTSINPTYYASNGYLVYMPDIVYTVGSPGQSALKCVLPAIQAVVDKGYVKEDGIGIQGHSWGGYQIAYMVTQTNRFKAAAAGAPVSNMTSAYSGIRWGSGLPRQFQYEHTQSRIGATLWEAPLKYLENSPVFMADRVNTPLLMLHNDQDDAVPWYQGIEYYLALRRLGKEVYLLNYNGELHGLRRKATQRDYTLRMQQFFDHHLKGAAAPEWMVKGVKYNDREKEKEQWKKLFTQEKN